MINLALAKIFTAYALFALILGIIAPAHAQLNGQIQATYQDQSLPPNSGTVQGTFTSVYPIPLNGTPALLNFDVKATFNGSSVELTPQNSTGYVTRFSDPSFPPVIVLQPTNSALFLRFIEIHLPEGTSSPETVTIGTFPCNGVLSENNSFSVPQLSGTVTTSLYTAPPLTIITDGSLTDATSGVSYSAALEASGGHAPYSWTLASGSTLPSGFFLINGGLLGTTVISSTGTQATTPGVYTFTVKVSDDNADSAQKQFTLIVSPKVVILTPSNNASPDSSYVALTGVGPATGEVAILVDNDIKTSATVDGDGEWEKVVYLGQGKHSVAAEDINNTSNISTAVLVNPNIYDYFLGPARTYTDYTVLQKADIFLTRGYDSPQISYYGVPTTGFNYTHTALYLGGDSNGTPMVAEAVTAAEGGKFGAVRDVPLEASTVWTDGTVVDIYRSNTPLSKAQRSAIVSWAQSVTNKGIPYWSGSGDFILFFYAWNDWNPLLDQPGPSAFLFQKYLNALDARKYATDRFICSTLVWHSYYAGTNGTLDLSLPNHATPKGVIGRIITNKLIQTLQPHFVFPDTLAEDGLITKVN